MRAALDFAPGAKWQGLGLDVCSYRLLEVHHAEVEFVARCREAGCCLYANGDHF